MARVVKLVSDITGKEASEDEFISLVVKSHPKILSPRQLDVLPDEVANIKSAKDIVTVEVKNNGQSVEAVMTLKDFQALVPDEVVERAPGTRGRRLGASPKTKA